MKTRICSVIGERIPLELLTRRALTNEQVAEIQVLLSSKSVSVFAFTFCHLLHWMCFGQTQKDENETAGAVDKNILSCSLLKDKRPNSASTTPSIQCPAGSHDNFQLPELDSSYISLAHEQRILKSGQHFIHKRAVMLAPAAPAPRQAESTDPVRLLKEELVRLGEASANKKSAFKFMFRESREEQRGIIHNESEWEFDNLFLEKAGELQVPLSSCYRRLKALAVAETVYKVVTKKIKVRLKDDLKN